MRTSLILVVLVFCITSATSQRTTTPTFDGVLRNATDGTVEAYLVPTFKANHASFIQQCTNGDLVMAWFSGAKEGTSGVSCVYAVLLIGLSISSV